MTDHNLKIYHISIFNHISNGIASSGKGLFHWLITKSNQADLIVLASLCDLMMIVCHNQQLYMIARVISRELGILLWHRSIQNY